jgi:hypothetical protein
MLDRAFEAIIVGALVVIMIHADNDVVRVVDSTAAALVLVGWFVAWRRSRRASG